MNNGHSQPYNPCNRVDNKKVNKIKQIEQIFALHSKHV